MPKSYHQIIPPPDPSFDLEKHDYSPRESFSSEYPQPEANDVLATYSSSSSRETSGSHQGLLSSSTASSFQKNCPRRIEFYKPPSRRAIRYLCLALFTTLLLFILSLIRASVVEQRQLEQSPVEKTNQPPPPWEDFPFLKRYFGGVRSLVKREDNKPEYPTDGELVEDGKENDAENVAVQRRYKDFPRSVVFDPYEDSPVRRNFSDRVECFLDEGDTVRIPQVHFYEGVPEGLPEAVMGAYEVLGLRNDVCFERFGRLGPYGYGYSMKRGGSGAGMAGEREGADDMWIEKGGISEVDYSKVRWEQAQRACLQKNSRRFYNGNTTSEDGASHLLTQMDRTAETHNSGPPIHKRANDSVSANDTLSEQAVVDEKAVDEQEGRDDYELMNRTAVVIRTWWDHNYSQEDIIYLRSMIAELSLLSGGEYTIHFLVHVKDDNVPIWADKQIYDRVLENSLPEEFRGMGVLWSERQMSLIYGGLEETFFRELPVHGVYRGTYMALQYFSNQHPEYQFLWNWELDIRNTGHWYYFLEKVRRWTRNQPRKGLWERNGRFYIPDVHGTWEDFKQMVRVQSEMGTDHPNNVWSGLKGSAMNIPGMPQGKTDTPVWGPESPPDMLEAQDDPQPPIAVEKDKYTWGVGEEADLITFSPLFDPDGTTWFYTDDVTGYNTTEGLPPRRVAIGTSTRLSKRLLQTMHRETVLSRHHMFSEMWPASISLHHGYKAVYAPHPIYIDRRWPTSYLAGVMNGGRNGASGGARTSVYGGREHNFKGTTWFYDAGFAPNLWRRWLGYKVDNDGGEQEEVAGEGRMCLPAVLLHPVKGVNLVVEGGTMVEEENTLGSELAVEDSELDWEGAD